jgi:hypothetical protein
MIKPNKMQYTCKYCGRKYKRKVYFDRHVAACELLSKSKLERQQDDERCSDTPTMRKMYDMLMSLARKNQALEKKVEELTKWAAIKKKKLHVIEWLNNNYSDVANFNDAVSAKSVSYKDMEQVCKYDYIEGITCIIQKWFPIENSSTLPIKAFDQKDKTLFIKCDDGWHTMAPEQFEKVISNIGKQLIGHFVAWQNKNKHRITHSDYSDEYTKKLQCVFGGNYSSQQIYTRIKRNIYKFLKMNLKNIIQFEFAF